MERLPRDPQNLRELVESDLRRAARLIIKIQDLGTVTSVLPPSALQHHHRRLSPCRCYTAGPTWTFF